MEKCAVYEMDYTLRCVESIWSVSGQ